MKYRVFVSAAADDDLLRLAKFLAARNPNAAKRAASAIKTAIRKLDHMPRRARTEGEGLHVLDVPFGDSGYAVWFKITDTIVVIARIFHMRENR